MPIRLIKVSKNLNVGINSLVEFLHKKGIEVEANPNAKIEDEQYDILIAEFGKDKNIRKEATETREKMHRRDEKRETVAIEGYELPEDQAPKKRVERETIETEVPKELRPQFSVVGNIDLDNLHKKKSEPAKEPMAEKIEKVEKVEKTEKKLTHTPPVADAEKAIAPPEEKRVEEQHPEETVPQKAPVAVEEPEEKEIAAKAVEKVETKEMETAEPEKEDVVPSGGEKAEEVAKEPSEEKSKEEASPAESGQEKDKEEAIIEEVEEEKAPEKSRSDKVFRLNKNKLESNIVVKRLHRLKFHQ